MSDESVSLQAPSVLALPVSLRLERFSARVSLPLESQASALERLALQLVQAPLVEPRASSLAQPRLALEEPQPAPLALPQRELLALPLRAQALLASYGQLLLPLLSLLWLFSRKLRRPPRLALAPEYSCELSPQHLPEWSWSAFSFR